MVDYGPDKKLSQGPGFDAVVGHGKLKTALSAVVTDPSLNGLLIRGERGTAKSTTVRALSAALPRQWVVAGCPYGCPPDDASRQCSACRDRDAPVVERRRPPLVTLPLGATRDRVVGTLSVADAMAGDHAFDPGLLARANRGILYVDEVNLLDDHLVDVLLDAAADGVNRVERDGVTVAHPASFTLVGTMNPEEGDLRPQLRDRFALSAEVSACEDIDDRVSIIGQALGDDTGGTRDESDAGERLATARDRLGAVTLPQEFRERIAAVCRDAGVDGHRGDIAAARAARTLAALDDRTAVLEPDVERALSFALGHRLASTPFEDAPDVDDVLEDHFDGTDSDEQERGADEDDGESEDEEREHRDGSEGAPESGDGAGETDAGDAATASQTEASSDEADGEDAGDRDDSDPDEGSEEDAVPLVPGRTRDDADATPAPDVASPTVDADGTESGRADGVGGARGTRVRSVTADTPAAADAVDSVRAAARRGSNTVESRDLRASVREGDAGTLVVVAVDASASMRPAMGAAKGAVLSLLGDAYEARDEVAVVTFAGEDADVVLPPTDSVSRASRHLKELPTGDRTPLPAGLRATRAVVDRTDPEASVAVVVTDGRTTVAGDSPVAETRAAATDLARSADRTVVVDAGDDGRAALTDVLVDSTDGRVVPLSDLAAGTIDEAAARARTGSFTN